MRSSTWFLSDSLVRTPMALVSFKRSSRVLRSSGGAAAAGAFAGAVAGAGFADAGLGGSCAGAGFGGGAFGSEAALGAGAFAGASATFSDAGGGDAGAVGPAHAAANNANPMQGRRSFILL